MAEDLEEEEERIMATMDEGLKKLMKGTRIALMRALVEQLGVEY